MKQPNLAFTPFIGRARLALLGGLAVTLLLAAVCTSGQPPFRPTNAVLIDQAAVPGNVFTTAASFGGAGWLATGSYAGDGVDNRAITGTGFPPELVLIKCQCNRPGVARSRTMTGDAAKALTSTGNLEANMVQSLDAGGFTLGSHANVNRSGETYYWVAMQTGAELALGTYAGNGADNRSIVVPGGPALPPGWVAIFGDGNDSIYRPGSVAGDVSYRFSGSGNLDNRIQGLEPGGFQVGSDRDVNQAGASYHYAAWWGGGNTGQAAYTGNGADNRSIAGVGWRPALVWVKGDDAAQSTWRTDRLSGDLSLSFGQDAASGNRIQALEALGFQVGTNAQVNRTGRTYHYLALRDGGP